MDTQTADIFYLYVKELNCIKSCIILLILWGCQSGNQKPETGNLPVIDLSKNYPKKEIRLQDIADIENIFRWKQKPMLY